MKIANLPDLLSNFGRLICILHRGALIGVIDMENISEFLRIQAALQDR